VRSFARGLRPPLIEEVGLGPALRALFEQHAGSPVVSLSIEGTDDIPRLPASSELAAYRVFQEALANALRHAGASRLSLAMRLDAGAVVISLTDDGRGFEPRDAARAAAGGQHLGLVSMRERAAFIGAELDVKSAPGQGTTVRLRVPPAPAPAPASPTVPDREPAVTS
jgi:signal transduction histidine kinase